MTSDGFAVRIKNISKIYHLWNSPKDRLLFPLKRLLTSFLPHQLRRNNKSEQGYREFYALDNLSFDIRKGESWGFIGVNGSGKSTLLKIISGNLRPSTGSVEVDGKVAILDYGSGFNGEFTGKENIFIKATLLGLTRKQIHERYDSIVEFAELGDFIHQPVKTYSSGMVARLGFAIMAHVDADIIITDEALAVGDVFFVQKCMKFIRSFLKKGTFLFVSHSTNDVLSLCQHAVWLQHGKIKMLGSAAAVTRAYLDEKENIKNISVNSTEQTVSTADENIKSEVVLGQPVISKLLNYKMPKMLAAIPSDYSSQSSLRNHIQVQIPDFDHGGIEVGGAKILQVNLNNEEGIPISAIIGGEMVILTIVVLAERILQSPLVGFQVIDRLGQVLFADNSHYMTCEQPVLIKTDTTFLAEFTFQMPLLPVGDYVVRAAVAVGETEGSALLLHTIDSALVFRSVTSGVRHGLVGIPMHSIKFKCQSVCETAS